MSPVEFKKRKTCRPVEFKGQGLEYMYNAVMLKVCHEVALKLLSILSEIRTVSQTGLSGVEPHYFTWRRKCGVGRGWAGGGGGGY